MLGQGITGWVAQHGQAVRTGDVDGDPLYQPVRGGIQSELCIPLIARGKVIGVLNIESRQPDAFSENDESLLTALANSAAISLENARLYQDALQAAERRAVLHRISQDIVRFGQDVEQIYLAIHEAASKLIPCNVFIISRRDDVTNRNILVYRVEGDSRYSHQDVLVDTGLCSTVINKGRSIILRDADEIEEMHGSNFGSTRQVQSIVAVPMRMSSHVIGMIAAQSYELHAYDEEEQVLLEMLAAHAATAIENGRLFESELKRRQEAENLRQAATAISSTLDPDQVLTEILKALKQVIHYDNASVFLHEGEWLRMAVCQGFPEFEKLIGSKFPARDELFGQMRNTQRPIIIKDAQTDPRFKNWGNTFHVHGWMSVPLITRGKVIGCITLDNFEPGAYSEGIVETAMAFANQAAAALDNARLFQEQSRRSKIIEALADIANEIATTRDVQSTLDQITQRALDLLNASNVAIYLAQDDGVTLKSVSAYGVYRNELLSYTFKAGEGISGNVFLNGKPEIVHDMSEDLRRVTVPGTPEKDATRDSLMLSPLILRGKTIGVINAWRLRDQGLFNETELNFLVGIAHQVSICIESGRLFQETSRQAQEAAAIAEVGRDITATLQLDLVLERIASYAKDLLQADTSAVYLADASMLHAIAALGADAEQIKNYPLPIGTGILGNIALQNIGEIVNDTANDPRAVQVSGTLDDPDEHIMGVPVLLKDKHIGLLAIWRSGRGTDFTPRELNFLTSLARQAAVAIENARLYDETRRRIRELEIIRPGLHLDAYGSIHRRNAAHFVERNNGSSRYTSRCHLDVHTYIEYPGSKDCIRSIGQGCPHIALLSDTLDARVQGEDREEDVVALLKEFGPPAKVAASYRPESQYLVGPELFPTFRTVISIALLVLVVVHAVIFGVSLFTQPDLLKALDALSGFIGNTISVIGAIVVIFYALQAFDVRLAKPNQDWDPRSLPAVDMKNEVNGGGTIFD